MLSGILYSRYDCSRPLWNSIVDLYDVSVGDLRRRFVSSDLAVRCVHVSFVVLHVLHVHVQVVAYVPDDH